MPVRGKGGKTATPHIWTEDEFRQVMLGEHPSSKNGLKWYETKHELEHLTNDDLDTLLQNSPAAINTCVSTFFLPDDKQAQQCL